MGQNIIEIDNLTKKYDSYPVVDQLSLDIRKGEIFGLLGPNGAGKSTAIRMILGLTEPTGGSVNVCGYSATEQPIRVKEKTGYLPEEVGFYNNLTGFENLLFTARLNRIPDKKAKDRIDHLLEMVGLSEESGKKTGAYSRGMKQRLGLADVLVKEPDLIVLDEPTLGLDPQGMKELLSQIHGLSVNEGLTVLFSSHQLHQVQHICHRVGLFVKGKLVASGNIQDLSSGLFSESPVVIEAGISLPDSRTGADNGTIGKLKNILLDLDGVSGVSFRENAYLIECDKDLSQVVAKSIVESNCGLISLQKKEYGLDDIYSKYFEASESDEK
jgi:ABC-2 type transport system ATP-binding protein